MVAAHHLTLSATVARPTAKNTTNLVGCVATVRTALEGLENKRTYPAGIQQILGLLFGDWDNIGRVFQEELRASKRGRLLIKRATLDGRFLVLELEKNYKKRF